MSLLNSIDKIMWCWAETCSMRMFRQLYFVLSGVFITPLDNCCPRGIFYKPLDFSIFPSNLIESFSRMVIFSFEKLTVCPVSYSCPTDTKDPVVSSGKIRIYLLLLVNLGC